ncbi:MAG: glycosyltransferase family 4 protein [Verrucomicrobiia bacterium]
MDINGKQAFVVCGMVGHRGGGCLAPLLLCEELARLGLHVTCFTLLAEFVDGQSPQDFEIVLPRLNKGHRWDWPSRCLAWQAQRRITRERPDYVFVMGITSLARYLLQSSVANQILIWEFTNANPGNKFVDAAASRMLERTRAVLSPSATIDHGIQQTYGYHGKILRLPFWIEDESVGYAPAPSRFVADFIFLGRRDEEKGLKELVHATAEVSRRFPDVHVLIAGPGSEEPYASLARKLGITRNISFEFFKTRQETLSALAQSRCLVLPSYHEGYPLVLLEAIQWSIPFIATRVGSVPDVFDGSKAAILISPKDVSSLENAMQHILSESLENYAERRMGAFTHFGRLNVANTIASRLNSILVQIANFSSR